jgi:DNA polymerase III alpha subunit
MPTKEEAEASPFYAEELQILREIPDGQSYYDYVLKHVELDRTNPKNSYYMFIRDKVDTVDLTRPCSFTGRATALPDIDVDFPTDYREKAIDYVRTKYGRDKVCQITTFGRYSGRSALKAVMRAEGSIDHETANAITEYIPDEAAISDQLEAMDEPSVIRWALEFGKEGIHEFCRIENGELIGDYAEIFKKALRLEGTFQNQGKHAAGVIISSEIISDVSPMCLGSDGSRIAALDMGDLEKIGLVKFDFLGVDILNKIQEVLGTSILNVPLDDPEVWETICSGNTKGIFQIENKLGRDWAEELRPHNIEELAALVSIIRPGTLQAKHDDGRNMTKLYCDRKNGEAIPDTESNKVIDTYGVLIYQETLQKICSQLAAFTSADGIKMMKSVGKKDAKLLFSLEDQFTKGCTKVGRIDEKETKDLFDNVKKSARYLFNKSHAVSYSYPAYWAAYIKTYKPLEFYKTWLTYSSSKLNPQEEVRALVMSARADHVEILPPSCHYLDPHFFIQGDAVVYGLTHIKGASLREIEKLFALMKTHGVMASIASYLTHILPNVNKRTVDALIGCGCFQYLQISRAKLSHLYECICGKTGLTDKELIWINERNFANIEDALSCASRSKKEGGACATLSRVTKLHGILERIRNPGRDLSDLPSKIAATEEAAIGIPLSCSYLDSCLSATEADTTCKEAKRKPGKMTLKVRVKEVKEHIIKKSGKTMAFATVEDDSGELDNLVIFSDKYEIYGPLLFDGAMVGILGSADNKGGKRSFVVERCIEL